eukprot:TRINITY_DN5837_c0_g1_i1.p1 TRINITY_DN5837_c0_g1~~TRINITY_DN5837_c0_g1_i1.p1  ORF type:complete len:849 (+),score=191.17 TRINITY_DN5837_c0_g1_i1:176-2722(+)
MASWIADSLKKVENILESVDQAAATNIQQLKGDTPVKAKQTDLLSTPRFADKHDDIRRSLAESRASHTSYASPLTDVDEDGGGGSYSEDSPTEFYSPSSLVTGHNSSRLNNSSSASNQQNGLKKEADFMSFLDDDDHDVSSSSSRKERTDGTKATNNDAPKYASTPVKRSTTSTKATPSRAAAKPVVDEASTAKVSNRSLLDAIDSLDEDGLSLPGSNDAESMFDIGTERTVVKENTSRRIGSGPEEERQVGKGSGESGTSSTRSSSSPSSSSSASPSSSSSSPDQPSPVQATRTPPNGVEMDRSFSDGNLASLNVENKMLRSKLKALNEELSAVTIRTREHRQALQQAEAALAEARRETVGKEQQLFQMLKSEEEFDGVLATRDSEISALRVQVEEMDQDVKSRDANVKTLQEAIEKLIDEKNNIHESHRSAVNDVEDEVSNAEKRTEAEREAHQATKLEAQKREAELQASVTEYSEALVKVQRLLDERKADLSHVHSQNKKLQAEARSLRQDLSEYKQRASRVLQEKEKAIENLNIKMHGGEDGAAAPKEVPKEAYDMLQEQLDTMKSRCRLAETQFQDVKQDLEDAESRYEDEMSALQVQLSELEERTEGERQRFQSVQLSLVSRTQELSTFREEVHAEKVKMAGQLKQKEGELKKVQRQLAAKSLGPQGEAELENRLSSMTSHLMQKQTQVQTLSSEKAALQLRLERAEQDLVTLQRSSGVVSHENDGIAITLPTGGQLSSKRSVQESSSSIASLRRDDHDSVSKPSLSSIAPKSLAKPAEFLDRVSTDFGLVLRRFPQARLIFICYLVLIHLWCVVVFYIGIETHDHDDLTSGGHTHHETNHE